MNRCYGTLHQKRNDQTIVLWLGTLRHGDFSAKASLILQISRNSSKSYLQKLRRQAWFCGWLQKHACFCRQISVAYGGFGKISALAKKNGIGKLEESVSRSEPSCKVARARQIARPSVSPLRIWDTEPFQALPCRKRPSNRTRLALSSQPSTSCKMYACSK